MTQPLAIITADWHILSHAWKSRPALCGDAECSLRQVTDLSRKTGLPIIAAGDLFDSKRPVPFDLITAYRLCRDTTGYYIQGNHEKQTPPWMQLIAPGWTHLEKQPVVIDLFDAKIDESNLKTVIPPVFDDDCAWTVYGIDYVGTPEQLQDKLDALEIDENEGMANLLVLHQSAQQTMPMDINELKSFMIPDGVDLVVLGHCHQSSTFTLTTKSGHEIPAISPGGFHLLSILESPGKFVYILFANGERRSMPLVTRRVLSVNLCDNTDSEVREKAAELRQKVRKGKKRPSEIEKPIAYARMNEATSHEAERIMKTELGECSHLFFKREHIDDATTPTDINRLENIAIARHAESGYGFIRNIFTEMEPDADVREIVEGLLGTDPSQGVYEELKTSFLEKSTAC
jgi:hypothetical protein